MFSDFSTHITNIFFKAIHILINQVSNSAWISIRKGELKGQKLVAKDVKNKSNLKKLLKSPIAYQFLRSIHTSPDYFENLQKDIFAMIQQLDPSTLFVTFTSAEHLWEPLINALKIQSIDSITNKTNKFDDECIDTLIKCQLVICSQYYKHRISSLPSVITKTMNYLVKSKIIFLLQNSKVEEQSMTMDYFGFKMHQYINNPPMFMS